MRYDADPWFGNDSETSGAGTTNVTLDKLALRGRPVRVTGLATEVVPGPSVKAFSVKVYKNNVGSGNFMGGAADATYWITKVDFLLQPGEQLLFFFLNGDGAGFQLTGSAWGYYQEEA